MTYLSVHFFVAIPQAEFVFLLLPLIRLLWFSFGDLSSFDKISQFPTFSIIDIFDRDQLGKLVSYPLKLMNIFELMYILFLSYLLSLDIRSTFKLSLKIIISSYGLGLILWVVIVSFIMVNIGM
jgi:hypothetical protein